MKVYPILQSVADWCEGGPTPNKELVQAAFVAFLDGTADAAPQAPVDAQIHLEFTPSNIIPFIPKGKS